MRNVSLKWGLIGGMISIIFGMILYLLGITDNKALQYLATFLMMLSIFFGQKEYKNLSDKTSYDFTELFKIGFLIVVVLALVSSIWTYIYTSFIDTSLISRILKITEGEMIEKGMSSKEIDLALKMTKKFVNPISMFLINIFTVLFLGSIVNAISAAINKTN